MARAGSRPVAAARAAAAALLIGLLPSGCMRLSASKPPGPWYEAYRLIDDPESAAFVSRTLEMAVAEFGEPAIGVSKVLLRRSRKTEAARRYRIGEDFSLTECADPANGVFVIYVGVDPDHRNYYALLGHECAHLLNHAITDWYMEGLATELSERACAAQGKDWGDWQHHFHRSRREPYALSYRMMAGLRQAFPGEYAALPGFAVPDEKREGWLRIDIDAWLATLPVARRAEAINLIAPYAKRLKARTNAQYAFTVPAELR